MRALSIDGTLPDRCNWFIILLMTGAVSFRFAFSCVVVNGSNSQLFVNAALISYVFDCISSSSKVSKVA